MLIDICHFRHQVWRLIIAISVSIIQNSKLFPYLDSVGISGVCLGSSRVVSAKKNMNIKGLRRDPWGTLVVVQAHSLV